MNGLRRNERCGAEGTKKELLPSGRQAKPGMIFAVSAALLFGLLVFAFTRTNLFDRTIALDDDRQGIDASAQFYQTE